MTPYQKVKSQPIADILIYNQVLIHRPAAAVNETSTVKGFQRVDAPIEDENRSEKDDVIDLSFKWAVENGVFSVRLINSPRCIIHYILLTLTPLFTTIITDGSHLLDNLAYSNLGTSHLSVHIGYSRLR